MIGLYLRLAVVLVYAFYSRTTEAVLCYSCSGLPHPADCGIISLCGSHEVCHVEHRVTQDGSSTYDSGCLDQNRCTRIDSSPVLGKRQAEVVIPCSKCCDSSYCNKNTCDDQYHPSAFGVRCLSCNDVLSPDDCRSVILCSQDSMCYTQAFRVNDEVRYRLGCAPKSYCSPDVTTTEQSMLPTTALLPPVAVGRRAVSIGDLFGTPCSAGCLEENCNRDLCINSTGCTLTRTPVADKCEDISKYGCILIVTLAAEQGTSACSNADIRNLCPASCGICTNPVITQGPVVDPNATKPVTYASSTISETKPTNSAPLTTKEVLVTTTTETVTTTNMYTPNACGDYYPEYACHKVDCEIQLCQDTTLRDLCPNYCEGRCMSRDCRDIPGFIPSEIN